MRFFVRHRFLWRAVAGMLGTAVGILGLPSPAPSFLKSESAAAAVELFDDFNDNQRDIDKWGGEVWGKGPSYKETNQRLEIELKSEPGWNGEVAAGYWSRCKVRGDFDAIVDYALLQWPSHAGVWVGISGEPAGLSPERRNQRSGEEEYAGVFNGATQGTVPTSDQSGKLRVTRVNSTVTTYYWANGSWAQIASGTVTTADARIYLMSGSAPGFGSRTVRVALDNFYLQATLVCPPGVDVKQTFGDGPIDAINPTGFQSDPVNSLTGNYVSTASDLSLPGIGIPFSQTRSYNALDTRNGPLGPGWLHANDVGLDVNQDGDVTVRSENGQRTLFEKEPDGSMIGTPGALSKLVATADGYVLIRNDQSRYTFDDARKATRYVDRNGQGLSFSYDPSGNLATATDSAGRAASFTHNASNLLTNVTLPDGRSVSYGYTNGRLSSVTDVRGGITTYEYDASSRLTKIIDQQGHVVVTNVYGPDGRVIEQTDGIGNRSSFAWDSGTKTSTMTDARGNAWKDVYADNVLTKRVDPLGNTTEFERNQQLDVIAVTDAGAKTTSMTYDGRHNLLTRTAPAPLSHVESFAYDSVNNLTSHTDGRSNTTTFDYDVAGNLIKITKPGAVVTEFTRAASTGVVTAIKDPRGKTTSLGYNAQGNLTEMTTPLGHKTTMSYDSSGRMTSLVEARGNAPGGAPGAYETTFAYDAADHLISMTDSLGNQTEWDYALDGTLSSQTDAKSRTTAYGYDDAHRLTSVTAPDQTATAYGYDPSGNLTSRTDANNHPTTYDYDVANRLNEVTSPTGQVWSYDYDANGNLSSMVDARGNATPTAGDSKTIYAYDVLNRLTGIDYSDSTPDVSFDYNANSNRIAMTDGAGSESYTYDALNRLTDVTRAGSSFTYSYDAGSNITGRTYPDGTSIAYTYDDDSRLTSVASGGKTTSYGYDPAGRLTTTNFPTANGVIESRLYDRAGRLSEIASLRGPVPIASAVYQRDEVGNPARMTTIDGTATYSYDALDRLTGACLHLPCSGVADPNKIAYGYDAVGNRTSEQRAAGLTTYSYNAADELTLSVGPSGTTTYTHDNNGNLTSDGSRSFTYDLANRMASATVGTTTTTYGYDGVGKRIAASAPSNIVDYTWDPNAPLPQLVRESNGSGGLLRRYVYGNDLISQDTPTTSSYYHHDGIGSVVATTSDAGVPQRTYSYEPFGEEHLSLTLDPTAPDNYMRFTGELFDQGTGLYHLRARQYDPGLGKFTATDSLAPLLKDPYVASYVYANNRPTVLVDPSGRSATHGLELCSARFTPESPAPSPVPEPNPGNGTHGCQIQELIVDALALLLIGETSSLIAHHVEPYLLKLGTVGGRFTSHALNFVYAILIIWAVDNLIDCYMNQ